MGRDMPGQSGTNEIKAGDNGINRGEVCDLSPQLISCEIGALLDASLNHRLIASAPALGKLGLSFSRREERLGACFSPMPLAALALAAAHTL